MAEPAEVIEAREALAQAEQTLAQARVRLAVLTHGPTHIDGVRDPQNPCTEFRNGEPSGDCETDGHYVCNDCVRRATCQTGCGNRPSHCECVYCIRCRSMGNECTCPGGHRRAPIFKFLDKGMRVRVLGREGRVVGCSPYGEGFSIEYEVGKEEWADAAFVDEIVT